jgi:hypothetical protein
VQSLFFCTLSLSLSCFLALPSFGLSYLLYVYLSDALFASSSSPTLLSSSLSSLLLTLHLSFSLRTVFAFTLQLSLPSHALIAATSSAQTRENLF